MPLTHLEYHLLIIYDALRSPMFIQGKGLGELMILDAPTRIWPESTGLQLLTNSSYFTEIAINIGNILSIRDISVCYVSL